MVYLLSRGGGGAESFRSATLWISVMHRIQTFWRDGSSSVGRRRRRGVQNAHRSSRVVSRKEGMAHAIRSQQWVHCGDLNSLSKPCPVLGVTNY